MKWEYKKVSTHQIQLSDELDVIFEEMGNKEWELVMSFGQLLIFKRPKMSKPSKETRAKRKAEEKARLKECPCYHNENSKKCKCDCGCSSGTWRVTECGIHCDEYCGKY